MRTGELAQRAGVNVETLRYYEREKLLPSPQRTQGGYRIYGERELETVRFIKRCQQLGFTLREIRELEQLHRSFPDSAAAGKPPIARVKKFLELSEACLRGIEQKIEWLQTMRADLAHMAAELRRSKGLVCPSRSR